MCLKEFTNRAYNFFHYFVATKLRFKHIQTEESVVKTALNLTLNKFCSEFNNTKIVFLLLNADVLFFFEFINNLTDALERCKHLVRDGRIQSHIHFVGSFQLFNLRNFADIVAS